MFWYYVSAGPGRWLPYKGSLQWFGTMLVLLVVRETGCFGEVAALHSDHYTQVSSSRTSLTDQLDSAEVQGI